MRKDVNKDLEEVADRHEAEADSIALRRQAVATMRSLILSAVTEVMQAVGVDQVDRLIQAKGAERAGRDMADMVQSKLYDRWVRGKPIGRGPLP